MPKEKLKEMPAYDAVCLRSISGVMEVFAGKWSFLVLEQLPFHHQHMYNPKFLYFVKIYWWILLSIWLTVF